MTSKQYGTIVEYECAVHLMKLGCHISIPLGEFSKYDMIADYQGHLLRLQCKSSRSCNGGFEVHCESTQINCTDVKVVKYSPEDIDMFCTIFNNTCYLIDVAECSSTKILRLDVPKNLQRSVNWAVNYEAEYILNKLVDPNSRPRIDMNSYLLNLAIQKNPYLDADKQYTYRWITNGVTNKKFYGDINNLPNGFSLGRSTL